MTGFHQRHLAVEIGDEDLGGTERHDGVHDPGAELVFPIQGAGLGVEGK